MEKKLSISVSKPCSEKFSQFKETSFGGFCSSCNKEVIDFRNMSGLQLIAHLKNNEGQTCGYFRKAQLKDYDYPISSRQTSRFNYLRIAGIVVFSLLSLNQIQAQSVKAPTEIINSQAATINSEFSSTDQQVLLRGSVTDENGPLLGVNIVLKDSNIGTTTNFDGEFEFPQELKKGDVLVFSYLGYKTENILITEDLADLKVNMNVDMDFVLMGEVDVNEVYTSKRSLWQKIKNIF